MSDYYKLRKIKIDDEYEDDLNEDNELYLEDEIQTTTECKNQEADYIPDDPDWKQYFPMESFREWQDATIEHIIKGWRAGKKYAIVEGPTGSGKSPTAIALGRYFNHTFLATPQKMLQNQYMRDFPNILYELKGRANYPCLRINHDLWVEKNEDEESDIKTFPRTPVYGQDYISLSDFNALAIDHPFRQYNCSNAPCVKKSNGKFIKTECKNANICEYIKRRDRALKYSNFTLMNFANLLLFSLYMPKVYKQRSLLILDECHTLEQSLYNYASITIKQKSLKPLVDFFDDLSDYDRIIKPFASMDEFVSYIETSVLPAYDKYKKSEKIKKDTSEDTDTDTDEDEFLSAMFSKDENIQLQNLVANLKKFIQEKPTEHSHVLIRDKKLIAQEDVVVGVTIKPFSVADLNHLAFRASNSKVLLMSATILDVGTFCKSLGIPTEEAFFIRVPSTFPINNRLIIGDMSVGSMTAFYKDQTFPKMMERIYQLSIKHNMHKGIIHTASHENMIKLSRWTRKNYPELHERLLFQENATFAEKEALIKKHMESKEATILCGPGFAEGIDLRDDLARFNMIMKVPMPFLGDPLIKRKAEEFPEWYALQTALTLIQAIGRTVRSPIDWSWIYILDLYWKTFFKKNKDKLFPKYIQDAIRWSNGDTLGKNGEEVHA